MDPNDEKDLLEALTQTENQLQQNVQPTEKQTEEITDKNLDKNFDKTGLQLVPSTHSQTVTNFQQHQIPILPKMFFPNSNVTINYNFGK